MRRNNRARALLDARYERLRPCLPLLTRPPRGFVRAIREGLGMSQANLAARLGVRQTTVLSMETSEVDGRIQLNTLARAAEALDCDLVYALVPRLGLQDMLDLRIRAHACAQLAAVNQTMLLENQLPADDEQRLNAIIETVTANPAGIWKRPGHPSVQEAELP